jgi:subtilisin family serine protease
VFSSYGPSSDGRIKPNAASVGWGTYFVNTNGNVAQGSGTSFSNPNLAGLVTCLWQAFPEFRNTEILDAIQKSSDKYANPDDRVGYGIPDMRLAYDFLLKERQLRNAAGILGNDWLKVFPVPFTNRIDILLKGQQNGEAQLQLIDAGGRRLAVKTVATHADAFYSVNFDQLGLLPHGTYFVKYSDGSKKRIVKVLK